MSESPGSYRCRAQPPRANPSPNRYAPIGSIRRQFYLPNGLLGKIHQEFTAPVLLGPGAA